MAIDKSNTQPWVKVVIIVVALSFVVMLIPGLFEALSGGNKSTSGTDTAGQSQVVQLATQYSDQVGSLKTQLASDPASATILVALGNAYFDWAAATADASADSGLAVPIWESATIYYERALKAKPGDASVGTDMAIAYFYGGETAQAVKSVEAVLAKSPEFPAALYNAGVFYQATGRNTDGIRVLTRYLQVDPEGKSGQIDRAKELISQMQGAGGATAPTTTP